MVRIKYTVSHTPGWGNFHASLSGSIGEYSKFNPAVFAYFCKRISIRYADFINMDIVMFKCFLSVDGQRLSCNFIPNNELFWNRVRYMIALINGSMEWYVEMHPSCNCGDMWKHWNGRCLNCYSRYCKDEEEDVSRSFNRLMDETFGI